MDILMALENLVKNVGIQARWDPFEGSLFLLQQTSRGNGTGLCLVNPSDNSWFEPKFGYSGFIWLAQIAYQEFSKCS